MPSVQVVRVPDDKPIYGRDLNRITDLILGNNGAQHRFEGYDGDEVDPTLGTVTSTGNYSLVVRNDAGNHLLIRKSDDSADVLTVTDAAVFFDTLNVVTLNVSGTATIAAITAGSLGVTGNTVLGDNAAADTLTVNAIETHNGVSTFAAQATFNGTLEANSAVNLGNADTDAIKVIGITTFRNTAGTTVQMEVDAGNNRVIVGSGTPMGSDTVPALHVVGRLYVGPDSANDNAILIRRSAAGTNQFRLGLSSTDTLVVKDITDTTVLEVDSAGINVTGDVNASDAIVAGSTITGGNGSAGTPTHSFSGDPNTGMYRVGADTLGFSTAGVSQIQISSTGILTFANTPTQNFALGGGAGATLGTIGGSGPTTATQNAWLKILMGAGVRFIPIWF